jgi:hypothetical protein
LKAQFMIDRPTETAETAPAGQEHCTVYQAAAGERLLWSARFPLPSVGDNVHITMNGIGPAVVTGFFKEDGYVGVMTKASQPPAWLVEQRKTRTRDDAPHWRKDGIGCEFGAEIRLP